MAESQFIFVSHGSPDNELTREVCQALETAVGDPSRVLVDFTDLKAGMPWPLYLIEWMVRCHGAVLLLTEHAIPRPWVLKEATILTARHALDPTFPLFVVQFPDTAHLLERHGYGPLALDTIQGVKFSSAEALASTVLNELRQRPRSLTPFDEVVRRLQDLLANVGSNALGSVAAKLNVFPERLQIASTDRDRWIEAIARHLACGQLGGYPGVHDLIDEFTASDAELVRKILRFVSPYWIDPEAASRLPRLMRSHPRKAGALNGADVVDFTARLYVRRAHLPSLKFDVIPCGGGVHDKYVDHVTSEICDFLRAGKRASAARTNDEIVAQLKGQRAEWYAVLPPPMPDSEALSQLLDRFPTITFLLWTGEVLAPNGDLTRVEWLTPSVDVEREAKERADFDSAEAIIERMVS
ncbi:MAG: toll/interleukin-1 receptor domain-containing protein [Vicinamibacterales bacterium]